MIKSLDHIQLAIPAGAEDTVRPFYALFGFEEIPKPDAVAGSGGLWLHADGLQVHFGVDPVFTPATKAHPAFIVEDIDALADQLEAADVEVRWDTRLPGVRRFFVSDPVGNRIELIAD